MRFYLLILLVLRFGCSMGEAMFLRSETKQVPIDRLFTNLQQRLARDTNDFETTWHLARLHSMAYSSNPSDLSVDKNTEQPVFYSPGADLAVPQRVSLPASPKERQTALEHLTNAIALYERAILLLKKSTNAAAQRWSIVPTQLGLAWCLDQEGRREDALAAYRKTLGVAWKMEVTGDFNLKEWLEGKWDDVRSGRSPFHSSSRGYLGPGVCYSQETIGYMLKLLDPVKDAKEIADLKERQQILQKMGRAVTPILVALEPGLSLAELVNPNARVTFDLDGSGLPRQWGWITPKAAWLVFDGEGRGQITSGLQLFGNVTFWIFWRNGYDALSALDADGDGILRGSELQGLALWQDRNSNGVSEPGEVRPLAEFGITAIDCRPQSDSSGTVWNSRGVFFKDGSSRPTYDWIAPGSERFGFEVGHRAPPPAMMNR